MSHPAQAAGAALLLSASAFALLAALPWTRTWGSASSVSGAAAVVSAQDVLGVVSLRFVLSLLVAGVAMLAYGAWRDRS